jgi:hypothetical protein
MSSTTGRTEAEEVRLERPGALDEWEVSFYRDSLLDPSLLDASVVVVMGRTRYLAVPVGERRRGGWISVPDKRVLEQLVDALKGRDGFPQARVRWSGHPDVCHAVAWGATHPRTADENEVARFYGLDPAAVERAWENAFSPA